MIQKQASDECSQIVPVPQKKAGVSRQDIGRVVIFFLLLFGFNTFRVVVLLPWEGHLNDVVATVMELVTKGMIWIGLPFLFLTYGEKQPFWTTITLSGNVSRGIVVGLLGSLVLACNLVFQLMHVHHPLHVVAPTLFQSVPVACDGILEEIAFRGYLLQKFQRWMPFFVANLLTAVLFVIMHIPMWMSTGTNIAAVVVPLLTIALALGFMVELSCSLWSGIIFHTANNVINIVLTMVGM